MTHDLTGAPVAAGMVTCMVSVMFSGMFGRGWNGSLSALKSLLETGATFWEGGVVASSISEKTEAEINQGVDERR